MNVMSAVYKVLLSELSDGELAAFNIAIQLYERVPERNVSYARACELGLIETDGRPRDLEAMRTAAAEESLERFGD